MADYSKTVEIIFGGKDQATAIAKNVARSIDDLETGLTNASQPFANAFDSVVKIDAALAALGAAMVGFSINEAAKFQQATAEISTLLDLAPDSMDQFSLAIRDYAADSVLAIEDINGAVYSAISAGIAYEDVLNALSAAEKLAVASNADLNSTLVVLASSMNAYGVSAEQAEEFSDALFTTVRLGQTTLPELAGSLGRVAAIAANSGISFDELNAAVAALTASGIKTSEAMSGLKAAISNILKPTEDAREEAERLGIQFDAAALRSKGLDGVLQSITGSANFTEDSVIKLFGSIEGLNTILALTGVGAAKFEAALSAMELKSGATATAFNKMADTVNNQIQNMVNNLRLVLIESGLKLLDEFGDSVGGLTDIFQGLRFTINETEAFSPIFDALNSFFADLASTLSGIGEALPEAFEQVDFSGFLDAFSDLGDAISNLFGDLDLTDAEDLAGVLQTLVNGGEALVRITIGMVESFQPLFEALAKGITEFNKMDSATFETAGNFLGIGKQVNLLATNMGPLTDSVKLLTAALFAMTGVNVAKAMGVAGAAFAGATGAAVAAGVGLGYVVEETTGLGSALNNLIPKIWGSDNSIGTAIYEWVNGTEEAERVNKLLEPTIYDVGTAAEDTAGKIQDIADSAENLGGPVEEAVDGVGLSMEELAEAVAKYGDAFEVIDGQVVPTLTDISETTEDTKGKTEEWVKTIVDGVPTFTKAGGSISNTYKQTGDAAEEATKKGDEYQLKLEEIASNERIKTIESFVDLNIAALEADAQKAVAIIEGLSDTIGTTQSLIGDLFGIIGDADRSLQLDIERQLRAENERLDRAADDQHELVQAQIDAMRERTEALRRGDGFITITADGLEQELQEIMFKIIERVQIQAALNQEAFLLGTSA